jgi:hypothetical protein
MISSVLVLCRAKDPQGSWVGEDRVSEERDLDQVRVVGIPGSPDFSAGFMGEPASAAVMTQCRRITALA